MLELIDVSLAYRSPDGGDLPVVDGVSLACSARQMACVAGRSGSGKTTLLHLAAGFLAPDRGVIRWRGVEVTRDSTDQLARKRRGFLGFIFQGPELIPSLTAAENVALVRGTDGKSIIDRKGATFILARLGLDGRVDHLPHQLSGGEQQRVAIARGLVGDPPVIILDEPTAYLDRQSAIDMVALLLQLRDDGHAVLVASHDDRIIEVADSVLQLE